MLTGNKINLLLIFIILFISESPIYCQEKLSGSQIDSIIAKGKSEIKNKEWGHAIDTFGNLLDAEPDNLTGNYYYAIGQRETGKSRNPLEQLLRFNSAEKHFKKIIALDSSFKDTFYQFAVLEFYRKDYFNAAELAKEQLKINNSLVSASTGIFHLYDIMLENEGFDKTAKFLKSGKSYYDKYFLGELYRRADSLKKAGAIFNSIIAKRDRMSLIPVYLSLVRLYVQEKKYEEADNTYWKAVNGVFDKADMELLLKDFEFILNSRDFKILYSGITIKELKKEMRIFWLEKNPLPSFPYNMRLIEHYKRLIYAEKYYRYSGLRLEIYDANKLELIKHPPWYYLNDKFNDRGIIYVRYGEPDDKIIITGTGVSRMIWLYRKTNRHARMIFYFMVNQDAPPSYWTLVPMLLDRQSLSELEVWDARFTEVNPQNPSTWYRFEDEGVKTAETGLETDSFTWPKDIKPLDADISVNQFKETNNANLVSINYAVPLNELNENAGKRYSLKIDILIFDSTMNPVIKKNDNLIIGNSGRQIFNNLFIDKYKFLLPKQKYTISIDISNTTRSKLYGAYFNYNLSNFKKELKCSFEQAFKITPINNSNDRNRGHISILPNPTFKFNKTDNVFTYYEIYNLSLNKNNRTNYSVNFDIHQKDESKSIWDFISGLFGKRNNYNISIQNNYSGTSRDVSNYLAFDISELEKGNYKFVMKIKDNISGKESTESSDLIVQ